MAESFFQQADTFKLDVKYTQDRLCLLLKDLNSFIVYEKQYRKSDIGKEIHPKVQLEDLYFVLLQPTIVQSSSEKDKSQEYAFYKEYNFGDCLTSEQIPCYKIQQGGKITIYVNLFDKLRKKDIVYESKLALQKKNEMSDMQIMKQKSHIEKYLIGKEMALQLQKLKKKCEKLQQQVKKYELEFKNIKSAKPLAIQQADYDFKVVPVFASLSINSSRCNKFQLSGNQIQFLGTNQFVQFIFYDPIPFNSAYSFKIKVKKCNNRVIKIGIVDYNKQKDAKFSHNTLNSVSLQSNGYVYPLGCQKQTTFANNVIVELNVTLEKGLVKWSSSNGSSTTIYGEQFLKDKSRLFMPFVQFGFRGDSIEWLL